MHSHCAPSTLGAAPITGLVSADPALAGELVEVTTEDVQQHLAVAVAAVLLEFVLQPPPPDSRRSRPPLRATQRSVAPPRPQARHDRRGQRGLLLHRKRQPRRL